MQQDAPRGCQDQPLQGMMMQVAPDVAIHEEHGVYNDHSCLQRRHISPQEDRGSRPPLGAVRPSL